MATDRQAASAATYSNGDPRLTVRERNWLGDQGQAQIEAKWNQLEDLLEASRKEIAELKQRLGYPRFAR